MTNIPTYSMRVFWSEEDASFIAVCPELHGVSAFGPSYEDAVRELRTAVELAVEVMIEDGEQLPAPESPASHSGQFRVRLPRSLHARLVSEADREGVSLNTWVVARLSESVGVHSVVSRLANEFRRALQALRALPVFASRRARTASASPEQYELPSSGAPKAVASQASLADQGEGVEWLN